MHELFTARCRFLLPAGLLLGYGSRCAQHCLSPTNPVSFQAKGESQSLGSEDARSRKGDLTTADGDVDILYGEQAVFVPITSSTTAKTNEAGRQRAMCNSITTGEHLEAGRRRNSTSAQVMGRFHKRTRQR